MGRPRILFRLFLTALSYMYETKISLYSFPSMVAIFTLLTVSSSVNIPFTAGALLFVSTFNVTLIFSKVDGRRGTCKASALSLCKYWVVALNSSSKYCAYWFFICFMSPVSLHPIFLQNMVLGWNSAVTLLIKRKSKRILNYEGETYILCEFCSF